MSPSAAQTPVDDGRGAAVLSRIGSCQCVDDHTGINLRCEPSAPDCEAACGTPHYSFVPLTQNALKVCRPQELYVVLPNADGRPGAGAISVIRGKTATLLDSPYAAAEMYAGKAASVAVAEADVHLMFDPAIGARPTLPRHFRVFFPSNGDRMVPGSESEIRAAVADIKARSSYQVDVIGNTDTVATETGNQRLSIGRAATVQRALIQAGVDPHAISLAGRADLDLLVPTPKGVSEPRNRRVEITVR